MPKTIEHKNSSHHRQGPCGQATVIDGGPLDGTSKGVWKGKEAHRGSLFAIRKIWVQVVQLKTDWKWSNWGAKKAPWKSCHFEIDKGLPWLWNNLGSLLYGVVKQEMWWRWFWWDIWWMPTIWYLSSGILAFLGGLSWEKRPQMGWWWDDMDIRPYLGRGEVGETKYGGWGGWNCFCLKIGGFKVGWRD